MEDDAGRGGGIGRQRSLYPTAGGNANSAIVIPANSIYWDLGTLAVNESRTVRFSAALVGSLNATSV